MVISMGLERVGLVVCFCWVPAHAGVYGNERADAVVSARKTERDMIIRNTIGTLGH